MDRPRVSLGRQVREISESLKRARLRDQFDFMFFQAVTPKMFQRHLLDQEVIPRYVHFAGFAVEDDPTLGTGLIMEDDDGGTQLVPESSLPQLFALFEPIDCLFLNAPSAQRQQGICGSGRVRCRYRWRLERQGRGSFCDGLL